VYGVTVQPDVWIPIRDRTMISATIWRPDAPRRFPAVHAADSYQEDLDHLPLLPVFHVSVHTDSRGTGHSPTRQWDLFGREIPPRRR
jgi:predicted acyl esterase